MLYVLPLLRAAGNWGGECSTCAYYFYPLANQAEDTSYGEKKIYRNIMFECLIRAKLR